MNLASLSIILILFSGCTSKTESIEEKHTETKEDIIEDIIPDSSDFYSVFKDSRSDLEKHELIGPVKSVTIRHDGVDDEFYSQYEFDPSGNLTQAIENGKIIQIAIDFGDYGLPIYEHHTNPDGSRFTRAFKYFADTKTREAVWLDKHGVPGPPTIDKFDATGKINRTDKISPNREVQRYDYQYDSTGLITKIFYIDGNFGDTTNISTVKYSYDKKGNWIKQTWNTTGTISITRRTIIYY